MKPGPANLITDVAGLAVGNAEDAKAMTGVTVIVPDARATAAVDVRGGGPGTRETDALDPANLVDSIDAIVLSGGSVFGLDAASGVTSWLAQRGRGFVLADNLPPSPVVPAAILFDLDNGGDKQWGEMPPYRVLGLEAADKAAKGFALGNAGAGLGAVAGQYKGGLGSASLADDGGATIGALIAVNAFGSPVVPGRDSFWASPYALGDELGKATGSAIEGPADPDPMAGSKIRGGAPGRNTTIGVVATDIALTPAQAQRVAIMAHDGLARAIRPVHTPVDGDVLFVLSTGDRRLTGDSPALALARLGALAGDVVARAVARGVYQAEALGSYKCYRDIHGA
jgi:L-aminopeptidase/D-esterase-like protein